MKDMKSRIVVGVDGSESSRKALSWAAEEAKIRNVTLDIVLVWSFPYYADPLGGVYPRTNAAEATEQREQELLDREVGTVLGDRPTIRIVKTLRCGSTARELLEAAKGADLLVLGSHGRGGFASMLLGSTSMHCVHHASCPVVVVPQEPR